MVIAVVQCGAARRDDLAVDFVDYRYPDKRRVRGLMQTGINVAFMRTPATENVQPMAKHHNKRKPILDGLSPIGFLGRVRWPVAYGAVGAA